ncbi:MAG: hypothetical protein VX768_18480 [Planctomycetota bacterium]|nr:hypothetical protein [Planctomycetota bacterium]
MDSKKARLMSTKGKLASIVFCVLCAPLVADQQRFQSLVAGLSLLEDRAVCKELSISKEQREKLIKYVESIKRRSLKIRIGLRNEETPSYYQSLKLADEFVEEVEKEVGEILLEFQLKRLKQFTRQRATLPHIPSSGFVDVDAAKSFGFDSEAAWLKLKKIDKDTEREIVKLQERFKKEMVELLEDRDAKLKALMSDKLRAKYDQEFGKPFARPLEAFMANRLWINLQFQIDNHLRGWNDPKPKSKADAFKKLKGLTDDDIKKSQKGGFKVIPD